MLRPLPSRQSSGSSAPPTRPPTTSRQLAVGTGPPTTTNQIHAKAAAWLEKELQKNKDNYEAAVEELENEGGGFESSGGESDSSAACQRRQGGRARRLPGSDYLF